MRRWRDSLDPKYAKICLYAGVTALAVITAALLLYHSGAFFARLWSLLMAVVKPLVIGGVLCYLLVPLANLLERKLPLEGKGAKVAAVVLTVAVILGALTVVGAAIGGVVSRSISGISLNGWRDVLSLVQGDIQSFAAALQDKLAENGITVGKVGQTVSTAVTGVKDVASTLVFSLIFAVYFLLDTDNIKSYWGRVLRLSADEEKRAVLQRLASDGNRVFSGYIRGQFIDALVVGVLAGVTMSLFGVPYAVVVGLLTGLGNLIPYMGTIVGYGSLALACLAAGDVKKFIVGAICLALVMVLDGNVINPRLLSQNIQVHPLLVVASLIAGGAIGGVVGMLVAVPVGAFLKLQLDHYLDRREEKLRAREAAEGPAPQDSERENP